MSRVCLLGSRLCGGVSVGLLILGLVVGPLSVTSDAGPYDADEVVTCEADKDGAACSQETEAERCDAYESAKTCQAGTAALQPCKCTN